ncbi:28 kDa movement protein [Frangipani mosaic virus]|uniref:Movement protein n=1 Tax=Frangipani mosaic virus TaxID=99585 RepID=E2F1P8_9VIRU|nr:28 kDa movement protein [Frangipani mosaic virus]ADN93255.1 28 kDa movement protein [Frangipani mosaic virus]
MALVELKEPKQLKVNDFVKMSFADKILPRSLTRLRTVSISETNVVKLSGLGSTVNLNILKGVVLNSESKYVTIRGVVISGVWMVPEGCGGGATVTLMDRRMKGFKNGLVAEFKTRASSRDFQFKFIPNYSMCVDDVKRAPWELFFKLVGVPIEDGYYPLAIEIATLVEQSRTIINHGLRATILKRCDDISDLELPSVDLDESIELISNSNIVSKRKTHKKGKKRKNTKTESESSEFARVPNFRGNDLSESGDNEDI